MAPKSKFKKSSTVFSVFSLFGDDPPSWKCAKENGGGQDFSFLFFSWEIKGGGGGGTWLWWSRHLSSSLNWGKGKERGGHAGLLLHHFFFLPGGQEVVEEQKWFAGKDGGRRELSGPALHYCTGLYNSMFKKKKKKKTWCDALNWLAFRSACLYSSTAGQNIRFFETPCKCCASWWCCTVWPPFPPPPPPKNGRKGNRKDK